MFWILLNDDANKRRLTHGNSEFIFDTPNLHNHQLSTERLTWYWWHTDLRSSDGWWRWNNFYFHCNNNFYLNRKHSMKVWTKAKKKILQLLSLCELRVSILSLAKRQWKLCLIFSLVVAATAAIAASQMKSNVYSTFSCHIFLWW